MSTYVIWIFFNGSDLFHKVILDQHRSNFSFSAIFYSTDLQMVQWWMEIILSIFISLYFMYVHIYGYIGFDIMLIH